MSLILHTITPLRWTIFDKTYNSLLGLAYVQHRPVPASAVGARGVPKRQGFSSMSKLAQLGQLGQIPEEGTASGLSWKNCQKNLRIDPLIPHSSKIQYASDAKFEVTWPNLLQQNM